MIRPAKFTDTPAIEALLRRTHKRSKYNGRCGIHEKSLNQLVVGLIAGHNQNGPQATHIMVAEKDGVIVGFMAGALNRAYNFLDALVATDVFLIMDPGHGVEALRLVDDYLEWARSNPKVIEIGLSWSDALPGAKGVARLYERLGARKVGEQYEIRLDMEMEVAA